MIYDNPSKMQSIIEKLQYFEKRLLSVNSSLEVGYNGHYFIIDKKDGKTVSFSHADQMDTFIMGVLFSYESKGNLW